MTLRIPEYQEFKKKAKKQTKKKKKPQKRALLGGALLHIFIYLGGKLYLCRKNKKVIENKAQTLSI